MIDQLFAYAGADDRYADAFGNPAQVDTESKLAILDALGYHVIDDAGAARVLRESRERDAVRRIPPVYVVRCGQSERWPEAVRGALAPETVPGYYDIEVGSQRTRVVLAPARAYVPAKLDAAPAWGIGIQLYALRSQSNWGIGDFGDLRAFTEIAANAGASFVGVNPLHQLHLIHPEGASPYAPLSRRFLNALYIDLAAAAREFGVDLSAEPAAALRASELIDYPGVACTKLRALERIFDTIAVAKELRAFERAQPGVRHVAIYEAIAERLHAQDPAIGSWLQWPDDLRDAHSPAVARFAKRHARRVRFFLFLQWLADRQLSKAAEAARGMPIGFYRDLAVGVDLASADVWVDPARYASRLSVGAPPDALNANGQNWGLPPLHPRVLVERAYEPFIALLRANMRHAGALRIDHVMGLRRLFCIPRDHPQGGGAYVNYDFEAMLGIVALESHRHRCLVVGEDLGTVPEGFRERLMPERIFSCRVLYFEHDGRSFRPPDAYPADAVASTGTHDLPPFVAYWLSLDERDRATLLEALREAACLEPDVRAPATPDALRAVYRFLGKTRSRLVLAQLEDMLEARERVNVPGTTTEEPNWRRKYSTPLEALSTQASFAAIARALRDERPLYREDVQ